jgi:Ribbon-helix-helix protein, copG family
MMELPIMPSRPVQISIDVDLLKRVDGDEETKRDGRSGVIRRALEYYLEAKRRRGVDARLRQAYGKAPLEREVLDLIDAQAWPEDG